MQTVQAFTHERPSAAQFDAVTERSFASAKKRIATRSVMTIIVISLVFAGIVGGPVDRRARRAGGGDVGGRTDPVPDLRDHGGRIGRGTLGNLGRVAARQRRDRAPCRSSEHARHRGRPPSSTDPCLRAGAARSPSRMSASATPPARGICPRTACRWTTGPGETAGACRRPLRVRARLTNPSQLFLRFLGDPSTGRITLDGPST